MTKNLGGYLTAALCVLVMPAMAQSFLSAQKFPGTADDLSFVQRMELAADGWDGYEAEYDANGNCISGCAYRGIRIEDEVDHAQRLAALARERLRLSGYNVNAVAPTKTGVTVPVTAFPTQGAAPYGAATSIINTLNQSGGGANSASVASQNVTQPTKPNLPNFTLPQVLNPTATCAHHNSQTDPGLKMPFHANPLSGVPMIVTSPFGPRNVSNGSQFHRGLDIRASMGTPVYATASGTVKAVRYDGGSGSKWGCGKYVEIQHAEGFTTQYCHLSEQSVRVGEQISAGCMIGRVGNTGGANMSPHLHYRINWTKSTDARGAVDPAEYLVPGTWRCAPDVASRQNCTRWNHLQAK